MVFSGSDFLMCNHRFEKALNGLGTFQTINSPIRLANSVALKEPHDT